MSNAEAEEILRRLYGLLLMRVPTEQELSWWVAILSEKSGGLLRFLDAVENSDEFKTKRRVASQFPPGHFHSPIVDPRRVAKYFEREIKRPAGEIAGISLDLARMRQLWLNGLELARRVPFEEQKTPQNRYYYAGSPFPLGDAITLRMIVAHNRPRRIIEIGSGFSSACMLDSIDQIDLAGTQLICIDPSAARLKSLLRHEDKERVTIIEDEIQNIDAAIVDQLERNDILFIDSTHVIKTASDVHYEYFYLIPRLKPGVIVHVHDVMYPFEYPRKWVIDDNYSWNEAYLLRAFLMYNENFRIVFWNSFFARECRKAISDEFPAFLKNPGGSIWLERVA